MRFFKDIHLLLQPGPVRLVQLGEALHTWHTEIAAMWRFTKDNGAAEGLHPKLRLLQRQAYGFRNFQSYRLRVKVLRG